jgi:hypothetical protein
MALHLVYSLDVLPACLSTCGATDAILILAHPGTHMGGHAESAPPCTVYVFGDSAQETSATLNDWPHISTDQWVQLTVAHPQIVSWY